jgi:cobalt/nickel transport system permease protein
MHVAEGVLAPEVLIGGAVIAAAGVALGLRAVDDRNMVKVAVMASAFFVASLINVPIGPSSAHLVLSGLTGLVLGWAVFPAVAVALVLHGILFGISGITAFGVNVTIMAVPGLACYYVFNGAARRWKDGPAFAAGFLAGAFSIGFGALLLASALYLSGKEFVAVAGAVLAAHAPIMIIEGVVTGSAVAFLSKVRPEIFDAAPPRSGAFRETAESEGV